MVAAKRVLLIDDNDADNVYHSIILRRCAAVGEVIIQESAHAALDYLRANNQQWPQLMLVDVNMPGMDGFAFVQQIANLKQALHTKVVMLTSSDADRDRRRASELPLITGYIIKPLTTELVTQLIVAE